MTFTVIGRCPRSGRLGIGLATYSLAVGGYCPAIHAGLGAVSSQAFVNPRLAPLALSLLALGHAAHRVMATLMAEDPYIAYRQIGLVDAGGAVEAHTGERTRPWAGHLTGDGFLVMGNVLAGPPVLEAMAKAFAGNAGGELDQRLLAALAAGRDAGGQQAADGSHLPERSASLHVHHGEPVAELDLRVDAHDAAVDELQRVHAVYRPYLPYYALRSKRPDQTPPQDLWARQNLAPR
ncbi:MAG: DUF1028 domain-containing protein [Alphaproteobacteria bacterium]|nr:DUF1028 domain-containing protein [Alphaproteobacteria bacterium]